MHQDPSANKRARNTSLLEAPARQPSFTIGTVERTVRPLATENPSPSASATSTAPPGPAPKLSDWLGLWRGKDTTRYLIPTFPSQPMDDPNARIRVESSLGQQIKLVLIDSSNEKDLCTLTAQVEGLVAKIEPGQPCFSTEDEDGGLSVHIKTGLGTLRDSTLTLDLTLDADVQTDQFQSKGTVEYHFEGKRS